jgi:hypothetical protein
MIQADKIYLCQGATPKIMDVGVPIIPLKIALDQDQLKLIVEEGEHVTVFGCAHSGVLVIDNLVKLGCRVTGIYRGDKPIKYDRDGAYDGIKGHAAPIADKFLSGEIKINFANWNNPIEIHKTLRGANKVVFACGFERINIKGGENYDPVSGKITGFDNVWGFGIAYPGTSTVDGRVYEDVSVLSFQEQIRRTLSMADKQ